MRERDYERAFALYDELDALHPGWLFEVHHPWRHANRKPEIPARRLLVALMAWSGITHKRMSAFFGVNPTEIGMAARRIWHVLALGDLEEDFEPEDVRREKRRRIYENTKSAMDAALGTEGL